MPATDRRRDGSQRTGLPRLSRQAIARPRLIDRLHGAIGDGLIVVQAPAGFGKTTIIRQFIGDLQGFDAAWVALDESCRVSEVLADRLARVIAGDGYVPNVAGGTDDHLHAYVGRALHTRLDQSSVPLVLVIDNVSELDGATEALELIDWLTEYVPEGVEIILSSRLIEGLPAVDRRLVGGECVLIGQADLAMTTDEAGEVLRAHGMPLDADLVIARTGGWPIAVAAFAAGFEKPGEQGAGSAWERYLARELWQHIPAELRPAVRRLCVPDYLTPDLARALCGPDADRAIRLMDGRLFWFEPGSDQRTLNPLVRSYVRDRFREDDPEGFAAAAEICIRSLAEEEQYLAAFEALGRYGLSELACELLATHGEVLLYRGMFRLLERTIEVAARAGGPLPARLEAYQARAAAHQGRPNEAATIARSVLARPESVPDVTVHAWLAIQRASRLTGDSDGAREATEHLGCPNIESTALRADIAHARATFELEAGENLEHVIETLRDCLAELDDEDLMPQALLARSTLGQALLVGGDGPAAIDCLVRSAEGWRRLGASGNLSWVLNNLGMAYLVSGQFEDAVRVLDESRREAAICDDPRRAAYAIASLGDTKLALGRYAEARAHYEVALAICQQDVLDESLIALTLAGLGGCHLGLGNVADADFFMQRALIAAEICQSPFERGHCLMQLAVVLSANNSHGEAILKAREAVSILGAMNAEAGHSLAQYRLALCLFRGGSRDEARDVLTRLWESVAQPWRYAAIAPGLREDRLFAQWAAGRRDAPAAFREAVTRYAWEAEEHTDETSEYPVVEAFSLGPVRVTRGGEDVPDGDWASSRAKELFFLLLANRDGMGKEEAVEKLYPDLDRDRCNSAFHSNVYRVRKALYQASVVKQHGRYLLNPAGTFNWDVEQFEKSIQQAEALPPGSTQRAHLLEEALRLYQGSFADQFYSEWAEAVRWRIEQEAHRSLATLGGYYAGRGDFESAVACMERLLDRDTFNEDAAYNLATYRAKSGDRSVALAFIDRYGDTYERELGENLPGRFRELRERIASGYPV